jgi:hypothetical protein
MAIHRFRSLSFPLTMCTFHKPFALCVLTSQSKAFPIRGSSILKPINERELSDDRRSVNQNGKENFVQNSTAPLSGYASFLNNLDAKRVPAVFASLVWRYSECTANPRKTTPVTKWENGFVLSGCKVSARNRKSLIFTFLVRLAIAHPPSFCRQERSQRKPFSMRRSF